MQFADFTNQFLILAMFALSLNLLSGYAGQVSIAHGAFAAVGGFLASYLALNQHWEFAPAVLIVIPAGGLLGALVGLPALRLSSEHLILLTLAVQTAAIAIIMSIPALGGIYGLPGVPPATIAGRTFLTPIDYLPLLGGIAALVLILCTVIGYSHFGRVLRGIREDETATQSLGKNVFGYKLAIFSISSGLAAFGGALFAYYNALAAPGQFDINLSITIVVIMVVGGSGNLLGSLVGAAVVVGSTPFLENLINLSEDKASIIRLIVYGVFLIAVLMLRPQGLIAEGVLAQRRSRGQLAPKSDGDDVRRLQPNSVPMTPAFDPELAAVTGECLVEVTEVSKSFGGIRAVDGLSMRLRAGTITGLIGPNGAGKTTVFNLLTGTLKPDAGTVKLLGQDVTGQSLNRIARVGMVRSFQDVRIFARLTALQNVTMGARSDTYAREQLVAVGLADRANVVAAGLSFGEQKLVALARVLATDARVILLDEPASGIDAGWVEKMMDIIATIRRPDIAICIVEHNLQVVQRLADHVYFMEGGRVTAEGPMTELAKSKRLTEAYFGIAP